MNVIQVFQNPKFGEVRAVMMGGEPWFVAEDVCRVLDIINSRYAISKLRLDDVSTIEAVDSTSKVQYLCAVSQFGLYNLVIWSDKLDARKFHQWITKSILPILGQSFIRKPEVEWR
jgi:prophage antirepressor-like protein